MKDGEILVRVTPEMMSVQKPLFSGGFQKREPKASSVGIFVGQLKAATPEARAALIISRATGWPKLLAAAMESIKDENDAIKKEEKRVKRIREVATDDELKAQRERMHRLRALRAEEPHSPVFIPEVAEPQVADEDNE